MNRKSILLIIVVLSALIVSPAWKQQQDTRSIAAYLIKVKNDVTKKTETTGWQQAILGEALKSGHQVRTDVSSLALIRFADETKLLVREKSIVEIKGQVQGRQILDRNVHTTRGQISFDVKKQEKEAFRFSSPISVASIRGTTGAYTRQDEVNTDLLTIGTGLATFTNLVSNQSTDVANNQTGIADGQGNLSVRQSTPQEQALSSTNVPSDEEVAPPGDQAGGKKRHELRFSAEDRQGNKKTIVIVWEE